MVSVQYPDEGDCNCVTKSVGMDAGARELAHGCAIERKVTAMQRPSARGTEQLQVINVQIQGSRAKDQASNAPIIADTAATESGWRKITAFEPAARHAAAVATSILTPRASAGPHSG